MPLPSHASSLIRSFRFERNTNTSPPYGSAQSACATSATRPCTPRRKSIGCVATHTRSPARAAIKPGSPVPPPAPATTSPCRHPSPLVCLRHPARSRSRQRWVAHQPGHRSFDRTSRQPSPARTLTRRKSAHPSTRPQSCCLVPTLATAKRTACSHSGRAAWRPPTPSRRRQNSPPRSPPCRPQTSVAGDRQREAPATPIVTPASSMHHAVHHRTLRQPATAAILSTRAENL